jgi:hypothetical protein
MSGHFSSLARQKEFSHKESVDVLVAAGGIPSWTTFLREEEDSRSQRKTIEHLNNTPEEKTDHKRIIKKKYTFQEEKSAHKKIIKWKYNFQEENSTHTNNKVNMKNQNKKSSPNKHLN